MVTDKKKKKQDPFLRIFHTDVNAESNIALLSIIYIKSVRVCRDNDKAIRTKVVSVYWNEMILL